VKFIRQSKNLGFFVHDIFGGLVKASTVALIKAGLLSTYEPA